jgi:hypothetical protein
MRRSTEGAGIVVVVTGTVVTVVPTVVVVTGTVVTVVPTVVVVTGTVVVVVDGDSITKNERVTSAARAYSSLPDCEATSVHVPALCKSTVSSALVVHTSAVRLARMTARPEEADTVTENDFSCT